MVGTEIKRWNLDYFASLDLCIQNNRLLPASNYCQTERKQIGVMSWTNVFRDEIEIIKTKGNFVNFNLPGLIFETQNTLPFLYAAVYEK